MSVRDAGLTDAQWNVEEQCQIWLGAANGQVDGLLHLD